MTAAMGIIENFLDLLYPPRCVLCRKHGRLNGDRLCNACAALRPQKLYRHYALRSIDPPRTLECRAPQYYEEPFRDAIRRFKFRSAVELAETLAKQMVPVLGGEVAIDCIVPVPVSAERKAKRGYDQSVLLAKALSKQTGIPCRELLTKTRHNRTQHTLPLQERRRNVKGVYRAENAEGLRILLVDDILTSGATAREAAETLYRAGALWITCAACAFAGIRNA